MNDPMHAAPERRRTESDLSGMPQTQLPEEAQRGVRSTEEGYRTRAAGEPYQMRRGDVERGTTTAPAGEATIASISRGRVVASHAVFALARVLLGFVFLWAFLDKLFGFGRSTTSANAWINGGSPTAGFLGHVEGPFKGMFNAMSGQAWCDWLFMIGMAGLGVALILGIGMIVAAVTGTAMMLLLWGASLPNQTNPFVDQHLIYALLIIGLAISRLGEPYGLGRWWSRTALVRKVPWLR
jgi:thiosulfate dehydrogenase [quinone] large subunit